MAKKIEVEMLGEGDEVSFGLAEHEVFLKFNGDNEAHGFWRWWGDEGEKAFQQWAAANPKLWEY